MSRLKELTETIPLYTPLHSDEDEEKELECEADEGASSEESEQEEPKDSVDELVLQLNVTYLNSWKKELLKTIQQKTAVTKPAAETKLAKVSQENKSQPVRNSQPQTLKEITALLTALVLNAPSDLDEKKLDSFRNGFEYILNIFFNPSNQLIIPFFQIKQREIIEKIEELFWEVTFPRALEFETLSIAGSFLRQQLLKDGKIKVFKHLKSLSISYEEWWANRQHNAEFDKLLNGLFYFPHLESIDFSNLGLMGSVLNDLCAGLKNCSSLTNLCLSGNSLGPGGITMIFRLLLPEESEACITSLDLSNCSPLRDINPAFLVLKDKKLDRLEKLNLAGNFLSSVDALIQIANQGKLTELRMSHPRIFQVAPKNLPVTTGAIAEGTLSLPQGELSGTPVSLYWQTQKEPGVALPAPTLSVASENSSSLKTASTVEFKQEVVAEPKKDPLEILSDKIAENQFSKFSSYCRVSIWVDTPSPLLRLIHSYAKTEGGLIIAKDQELTSTPPTPSKSA